MLFKIKTFFVEVWTPKTKSLIYISEYKWVQGNKMRLACNFSYSIKIDNQVILQLILTSSTTNRTATFIHVKSESKQSNEVVCMSCGISARPLIGQGLLSTRGWVHTTCWQTVDICSSNKLKSSSPSSAMRYRQTIMYNKNSHGEEMKIHFTMDGNSQQQ